MRISRILKPLAQILLSGGILLRPVPAAAYFVDREMDSLDTEALFDSEYFLHPHSFDFELEWSDAWDFASGPAYWVQADNRNDFVVHRVNIPLEFKDWLLVSAEYSHSRDNNRIPLREDDADNGSVYEIEVEVKPTEKLGIHFGGDPVFDNRNDAMRLGVRYNDKLIGGVWANMEARDVYFNGAAMNRYDRRPYSFIYGGIVHIANEAVMAEMKVDTPLIRNIPAEDRQYKYRRMQGMVEWRHRAYYKGAWDVLIGYHYDFKREVDDFSPDPRGRTQEFHRTVHHLKTSAFRWVGDKNMMETGVEYLLREGETDFANRPAGNVAHTRWEAMPHFRWRHSVRHWAVGEAGLFLSVGERRRDYDWTGAVSIRDKILEAKLGLGTDIMIGKHAMFGIYTTYDLDTPRYLWDGGIFRMMVLF